MLSNQRSAVAKKQQRFSINCTEVPVAEHKYYMIVLRILLEKLTHNGVLQLPGGLERVGGGLQAGG